MSKTVLITGGTSGIGKATALALAKQGMHIILLARNEKKAKKMIQDDSMKGSFSFIKGDLSDLKSVQEAAALIKASHQSLDILINNAGGIFGTYEQTQDGLEWGFQVNHLGHFLLTKELMPLLLASESPKVINLSSEAHQMGKYNAANLNGEQGFSGWKQYGATKLMNILFTKSLLDHYQKQGLNAYAVHPGVVKTNFGANNSGLLKYFGWLPFLKTPEQGAATTIHLATTPASELKNGYYYKDKKPSGISKEAIKKESRDDLWEQSLRILREKGLI